MAAAEEPIQTQAAQEVGLAVSRLLSAYEKARQALPPLSAALESAQSQLATASYRQMEGVLARWQEAEMTARQSVAGYVAWSQAQAVSRTDLTLDPGLLSTPEQITAVNGEAIRGQVEQIESAIATYDRNRAEGLAEKGRLLSDIAHLRSNIEEWTGESVELTEELLPVWDSEPSTLTEITQECERLKAIEEELRRRRNSLHSAQITKIAALVAGLQKADVPNDSRVLESVSLGEVTPTNLENHPPATLKKIERELMSQLAAVTHGNREAMQKSAEGLRQEWTVDAYVGLMESLVQQNLDEEALLLLLAANMTNPSPSVVEFSGEVAESLIRGVQKFSDSTDFFNLVGLISSIFYSGWRTENRPSNIKLSLLFLVANRLSLTPLVSGFLWNVATEWPDAEMINWGKVWQGELLETPVAITSRADEERLTNELARLKEQAAQTVEQESGQFVRARSLKSARHRTLMIDVLMPRLAEAYEKLEGIDRQLQDQSYPNRIANLVGKLEALVDGWEESLSAKQIEADYESARTADGIHDQDSFHRRTTIRLLEEIAEAIVTYGRALRHYWDDRMGLTEAVHAESLHEELLRVFAPESLVFNWMEAFIHADGLGGRERDETQANALIAEYVVSTLLSQVPMSMRMPRLVGYLSEARLDWEKVLEFLLADLSQPAQSTDEAAKILMEAEAASQAVLLATALPVNQQKAAQKQLEKFEREIAEMKRELEKLGGSAADLDQEIHMGRWRFVRRELASRVEGVRAEQERIRRQAQDRSLELMRTIHRFEEDLLIQAQDIPRRAVQYIQEGLVEAKSHLVDTAMTAPIATFLDELAYRFDHQSWELDNLEEAVEGLRRATVKSELVVGNDMSVDLAIELLEANELRQLGINPSDMVDSEVETRIQLLRQWKAMRDNKHFLAADMTMTERAAIGSFYQYFAQMVSLKYCRTPKGDPLVFEDPIIYSMYDLKYPKTSVLQFPCILLAIPGSRPTSDALREVTLMIDDQKWLSDAFVLLFVPGCTPQIRKRLTDNSKKQRLIIFDEDTLLSVVFAKMEGQISLGRLRALMLNAVGAETADVFLTNQLVDMSTSIFVGRDSLIRQITSSGDSFALYGGRRIGKSSVLVAIWERLKDRQDIKVVFRSAEGDGRLDDDSIARRIAQELELEESVVNTDDLKSALQNYLETNQTMRVVILMDEIDKYIESNKERHLIIEVMRSLSDRFRERFRIVVAGFMALYDCLKGRGPYTPTSDPWQRMINDIGPLPNLKPTQAELIVREGFINILGWRFDSRTIPQWVVQRTGGHPAFVQYFCKKLQERVGERGDQTLYMDDVEAVFEDQDPELSFVAYVRKTLAMNLTDPIGRFLILYLALESKEARRFTFDQLREYAGLCATPIPEDYLPRNLEILEVTSVVRQARPGLFEFSVPDYPLILNRLGETEHLNQLEEEIARRLQGNE